MANIVHPLLTLLASLTRQELAQQIRYLKAENEILRSKLPKRITLDNRERNTLVKHGKKLGGKIKDVMTIVSYSTFRRWVRRMEDDTPPPAKKSAKRGSGRPRLEDDVRDTIIRIRKETGFGYTKILQELRTNGRTRVSANSEERDRRGGSGTNTWRPSRHVAQIYQASR